MGKLDYVELPVQHVSGEIGFYSKAFGWKFTEYGPEYAAHEENETQMGLNATQEPTKAILPLIRVDQIEQAYDAVVAAGGSITREVFPFPGGRRFHFNDPAGLELGCYEPDDS